ncbi:MAG: biopolymer transporter ExbD [Methylacidiphilales bacterium]|nr:biopolymer transporter ExbD [Candidatus Methylacidiphilales bacterium]MDW8348713.1 biopolymer transporter ExbD [Verrucomicrobiae bacterium]
MIARRRPPENVKVNITPMIDMVFLLLVFFMVTSKITTEQKKLEIRLPIATAAKYVENQKGREIINIDAEGRIFTGDKEVDMKGFKAYLKKRLIEHPPLQISVRADARTTARRIKEVMEAAAEAGAIEVIFATYKQ